MSAFGGKADVIVGKADIGVGYGEPANPRLANPALNEAITGRQALLMGV